MRRAQFLVGITVLLVMGCATNLFDRYFEAGQYELAAREYETDPSIVGNDRGLYRLGLTYAAPGTPVYDPERARDLLAQLETRFPNSKHRATARIIGGVLGEIATLRSELAAGQRQRDAAQQTIKRLEQANAGLLDTISVQRRQLRELQEELTRVEAEVEAKDAGLRRLENELERLKRIDLERPAPSGN
jgi:hypothetical protein